MVSRAICCVPRSLAAILALAAAVLVHPPTASAQCGPTVVGRFGGEVSAVTPVSTALLVARGTELELYSLAIPPAPAPFSPARKVSLNGPAVKVDMTPGATRAFVLLQGGEVQAVSISYSPLLVVSSPVSIPAGHAVDILADGQRVYVASQVEVDPDVVSSSIQEWDLTSGSPVAASLLHPLTDTYEFDRLARVGNTLWAAFHEHQSSILGVDGFDVTNPAQPTRVGSALTNAPLGIFTRVSAMAAAGTRVLVSYLHDDFPDTIDWLRAADVTDPAHPAWQTPANLNGVAACMASTGNLLRVSIPGAGVGTWDTTNPANLTWLGAYFDSFPRVSQIYATSVTDYWAGGPAGLMTVNTSNPAFPMLRSTPVVPLPTGPSVVRQRGNTTVVLDHTLNALRLYDFTLPEAQQLRASLSLPLYSELLELGDLSGGTIGLACVASWGNPSGDVIAVIDITNPAAPVLRSTITGFSAHLLSVSGSRLYTYTTNNDFKIIELASPTSPQVRSTTHFGGGFYDYTCLTSWSNNAAALGTGPYGLWLIDTTNATAPVVSAVWNPVANYHVRGLAKGQNWLYVSAAVGDPAQPGYDTRLETLNVTNLAAPTQRFVANSTAGAGPQGELSHLAYIAAPAGKFLVGTRESGDPAAAPDNTLTFYELPTGGFTQEAVPFPIATQTVPLAQAGFGVNGDGSRLMLAGDEAGLYQFALPTTWAPGFGTRPLNQYACYGTPEADFTAIASGNPTSVTYQWYRDNVPLTDGPTGWGSTISGSTSFVLSILSPRVQDARTGFTSHAYQCVATNSCGSTPSGFAFLTVCPADVTCDRLIAPDDVARFVSIWFADLTNGTTIADFTGNGVIEPSDIAAFVGAWFDTLIRGYC